MPSNELPSVCQWCGAAQSRRRRLPGISFGKWRHEGDLLPMWECYTWFDGNQSDRCQISCLRVELTEARDKLAEVEALLEQELSMVGEMKTYGDMAVSFGITLATMRNILHPKASVNQ